MKKSERELFYKQCIEEWGFDAQMYMCIEEMSELTKEFCKYRRLNNSEEYPELSEKKKENIAHIQEEIADVLNTVEQMAMVFGEQEINKVRDFKVERCRKYFKNQGRK